MLPSPASNPTVLDPVKTRLRCGPSPVLRCPLVGVVALVATNDPVGGNPGCSPGFVHVKAQVRPPMFPEGGTAVLAHTFSWSSG